MTAKADRPGGRMPRTTILAACAVALAGCVLCAPTKAQQQPPNPNAPAPAVQTATPDQHQTAPSPAVATETPPTAAPSDPQKQCVKPGEFAVELRSGRNPVGGPIVLATNFLPTNQRVDIGV